MKRNAALLLIPVLLWGLLSSCGHAHSWREATCEAPRTCAECGEILGEPLGHSWAAATCTEAKTCSVCGAVEGEALGHSFGPWSESVQGQDYRWQRSRSCSVCLTQQQEETDPPAGRTDLGSAGSLQGTTLLVSIFADDADTAWDFEAQRDLDTLGIMRRHLDAGVQWLTAQAESYGVTPRFVYDWEECPDLCHTFDFGQETLVRTDGGGYRTQEAYVEAHIPTQALKEKYGAQNVIYMFFFNTDEYNTVNSWSLSDRSGVETEIVNVFVRDDYYDSFYYMPAASFAHEIMHCFGAYDLYYASEAIPQSYVDHCYAAASNDIMFAVGLGDTVTQELTRLDAYYMGLVDSCEEVDAWGLGKSSHFE